MFSVTARPESLTAAATALHGIGMAMEAQNASVAAPTAGVVPAAADEISALQAAQFAAYGTLYQRIGGQAAAINEMIANTLASNADSYVSAEAVNAAGTGASDSGSAGQLISLLTATVPPSSGTAGLLAMGTGNTGIIGAMQMSNFGSAVSDFFQLGTIKPLLAHAAIRGSEGAMGPQDLSGAVLTGAAEPVAASASGAAPAAGPAIVATTATPDTTPLPPNWAGEVGSAPSPAVVAGAQTAAAAGQHAPSAIMSAGLPALAAAQRAGFGRTPRYGVKPTVMPKPHRAV